MMRERPAEIRKKKGTQKERENLGYYRLELHPLLDTEGPPLKLGVPRRPWDIRTVCE